MERISFNDHWFFRKEGDEQETSAVTLPHDAMLSEVRSANSPGGTGGAYYHGGTYIYEKVFAVPLEWSGKYICLEFEGVYRNATVYINGKKAAFNAYGYVNFFAECSPLLNYGEENRITVEVDNSDLPNTRWYSGSGIYRPVWLYVAQRTHIVPHGIRVSTLSYAPAKILVEAEAIWCEESKAAAVAEICKDGKTLIEMPLECLDDCATDSDGLKTLKAEIEILEPCLWSAESPELYECRVSLLRNIATSQQEMDTAAECFGIRKIAYSAKGLFVNGKSVKLRGGCVHHDNGVLGACTYEEAEDRRVRILKETGFNAIRSAHNPCSESFLRACDRYGMYLVDEMWDMWYERKNRYDYGLDFMDHFQQDLTQTIARDYNHPCVLMYSVGNENLEPYNKKGLLVLKQIVDLCHQKDLTRPVTMGLNPSILYGASKGKGFYHDPVEGENAKASGSTLFNMIMMMAGVLVQKFAASTGVDKVITPCADLLDVVGYNYATGRYKKDGKKHPNRLLYGSETMPYHIAENWEKVQTMDHVCGDFFWTAWDYLGEAGIGSWSYRKEAVGFQKQYPWKLAEAGAIDLLGKAGAEAAYAGIIWGTRSAPYMAVTPPTNPGEKLNKAYWRGTNAVESWSWHGCEGNETSVEVYALGDYVQLELNGFIVGKARLKNRKAIFSVRYTPGTLRAVIFDQQGKEIGCTELVSAKDTPIYLKCQTEKTDAVPGDVVFIDVCLTDADGIVESNRDQQLRVAVENGELLGFGSAQPCTEERFTSGTYTTYLGRALAVVRKTSKKSIRVCVKGENCSQDIVIG